MVATNPFGKDTLTRIMKVLPFPTANFSAQVNELTAVFNNTSNNANSYLWDFGDGTTATDKNPLHTYAAAGTYTVRLQSTNVCRTAERVTTLVTTVGANNLPAEAVVRVSPNPTTGDFEVWTSGAIFPTGQVHCRLTDASGKVVAQVAGRAEDSGIHGTFRGHKLPQGVYQLQIVGDTGTINTRVVVVK
jgi:PKD repeat protein